MKNIFVFAAALTFLFCILPIATAQAAPQLLPAQGAFALNSAAELHDPALNNILARNHHKPGGIMLAKDDTEDSQDENNNNPYIKRHGNDSKYIQRRGHGRSTMREKAEKNTNEDGENFRDDSAIKYNTDLDDDRGYNKDL